MLHARTHLVVLIAAIAPVALHGCAWTNGSATSSKANAPAQTAHVEDAGLDDSRDLRLFGRGGALQDISFEGKAAINIQQHTTGSEGADFDPSVDAAGKQLVFASTRHSRMSHLYVKPTDGATLTQLTDGDFNDAQPVFSPDGTRIAFTSDRSGQWDVWMMDSSGRNPTQLTNSPMPELHPSWSPDGEQLVYCRINPKDSAGELWIIDLENPGAKRIIGEGLFPAWSPKGDRIAYQKARRRGSRWFSIWTMTLVDGEPTPPTEVVSNTQFACIAPSWSMDGSQIAFALVSPSAGSDGAPEPRITGAGRADIAMIDVDGRGLIRLTNGRGENYSPMWSADDRIYFTAKLDQSETIWSIKPFRPVAAPAQPAAAPVAAPRHAAEAKQEEAETQP
ncbi:MAG: PD40 domain-containing protein [Planctomycetes bacterium]|nr:PD40 domain-containing protein [Planctomycetota bacterium]